MPVREREGLQRKEGDMRKYCGDSPANWDSSVLDGCVGQAREETPESGQACAKHSSSRELGRLPRAAERPRKNQRRKYGEVSTDAATGGFVYFRYVDMHIVPEHLWLTDGYNKERVAACGLRIPLAIPRPSSKLSSSFGETFGLLGLVSPAWVDNILRLACIQRIVTPSLKKVRACRRQLISGSTPRLRSSMLFCMLYGPSLWAQPPPLRVVMYSPTFRARLISASRTDTWKEERPVTYRSCRDP